MDAHDVRKFDDARRLISGVSAVRELQALATEASHVEQPRVLPERSIVAGAGIDLSGTLDCGHRECLRREVDHLFGRIWHYFDTIVVEAASAHTFGHSLSEPESRDQLLQHVDTVLYLREIGAWPYVTFRDKPNHFCDKHWGDALENIGLSRLLDDPVSQAWRERLCREAKVHVYDAGDHWRFQVEHPELVAAGYSALSKSTSINPPSEDEAISLVFAAHARALAGDIKTSEWLKAPLALSAGLTSEVVAEREPTVPSVALDLELPVLRNVPIKELMALREDERESFDLFRHALEQALTERVKANQGFSSWDLAQSVVHEVVEPALTSIDLRLNKAQSLLTRKTALSIGVGVAVATVGALAGAPLVIGAGVAMAGTSLADGKKYLEEHGDVEMSDMYFLWRASSMQSR